VRFTVIGEALVDLVQSREDARFSAHPGGSAFNVAITLARLGDRVAFAGQRGADGFGELLGAKLLGSGVRPDHWRTLDRPSSLAVAALDDRGQAKYSFYFGGTAGLAFEELGPLPATDVLHAGSIASWLPPAAGYVQDVLRAARSGGTTLVSYDPNVRPALVSDLATTTAEIERCIALAHVVKASDEDVATLHPGESVDAVAARWCALGAALVVVTRGADGAIAFGPGGELLRQAAPRITVADTVGAGDSFAGALLSALAGTGLGAPAGLARAVATRDARLAQVLGVAVAVSAFTCQRPGADPPTRGELDAYLSRRD
jgi:fructokinase